MTDNDDNEVEIKTPAGKKPQHIKKILNLNVEIKDLPADSNQVLNALALLEGKFKWQVIRDALIFYANHRKVDLSKPISIPTILKTTE